MTRGLAALLLALAAALWAAPEARACVELADSSETSALIDFRPARIRAQEAELRLRFVNPTGEDCRVRIAREAPPPRLTSESGDTLDHRLRRAGGVPLAPRGRGGPVFVAPAGGSAEVVLIFAAPPGQNPRPGLYTAAETLDIIPVGSGGRPALSLDLALAVRVEAFAAVAVAGEAGGERGAARIDFGTMSGGEHRALQLAVAGNADYDLRFTSREGGRLVNETAAGEWIAYEMRFDGRVVDLVAGDAATVARAAGAPVQRHALDFRLPPVVEGVAGTYRDTVTVEVTPRR